MSRLISTTSKDDGLSSDPNADAEIDDETTSFSTTSTDIEHNLQVENTITSDPVIRSTRHKYCYRPLFCLLYLIAMIGSVYVGVDIICGTPGNGLNPLAANILMSIGGLLFYFTFLAIIRDCYREDPTLTIRGFYIVLGMWAAGNVGCILGIYPYIAIFRLGKPSALVVGVPLYLLACFILGCRRKALLIKNMLGVIIICGTPGNGLNPLAANMVGVLLISIGVLLFCLPFAIMIRDCYREDPTQAIRGFYIILGMWAAGIVGSFIGIYPYIAILRLGQPCALVVGVPLSLLACFILGCRRKALLIQNMLHEFYSMQVAVTIMVVNFIPFGIILFFNEERQETVRTAPLGLFIWTVFWQFLFLTTATMTWINLIILSGVYSAWALVPLFLWPFLLYRLDKISASFVDWLVVTHGQQHLIMVGMLIPRFEIVNDTEDVISSNQIEINVISSNQIEIV